MKFPLAAGLLVLVAIVLAATEKKRFSPKSSESEADKDPQPLPSSTETPAISAQTLEETGQATDVPAALPPVSIQDCRPVSESVSQASVQTVAKPAASSADNQDGSDEKFSPDDDARQLEQALALVKDVKALEKQFEAISSRLPEPAGDQEGQRRSSARQEQLVIVKEQLRIARSYASDLMRFVLAAYQSPSQGQYVPSFSDASWAFTAGHLTLSFARARIVNLD